VLNCKQNAIAAEQLQKANITNNLKQNLSYLIKKYQIDNETLAKCTGVAQSTIASLRSRTSNPTVLTLQALADFFNVTIDQLITQNGASLDNISQQPSNNTVWIPIIDIVKVADWPFIINTNQNENPDLFVNTRNDIHNLCFAVKLNSEVLMPFYQKNTIFIIDPNQEPKDSNIVLVDLECQNKITFRQLFIDATDYYFKPINPEFSGMQMGNNFKIYGVVIRALQNFQ
jgi:SOS-response transcriptional repressor LexA